MVMEELWRCVCARVCVCMCVCVCVCVYVPPVCLYGSSFHTLYSPLLQPVQLLWPDRGCSLSSLQLPRSPRQPVTTPTRFLYPVSECALIRPNHWAASVAQWLEQLSSKQCVVGSNPTRAALFSFRRKKSCLG